MKPESLYIHIPFCAQKCAYCDFVSFCTDDTFRSNYLKMLYKELHMIGTKYKRPGLKTIFIGGGTPSLLSLNGICELGDTLRSAFDLESLIEFSIEANPGTVTRENLQAWKGIGVNRISMGVQTMNNTQLKILGRIHTAEEAKHSFELLRDAGFDNINLDIMFGLPNQTLEEIEGTLLEIIQLGPEHISAYSLKVEEGTPFDKMLESGNLQLPSEEEDRQMYHAIVDKLSRAGYEQYEISNFSKTGFECKHNLVYWKGKAYFAAGMAAHGYVDGIRAGNYSDFKNYSEKIKANVFPVESEEFISEDEAEFEFIMLGLRLNAGISFREFQSRFNKDIMQAYSDVITKQVDMGTLEYDFESLRLTKYGRDVANTVLSEFMS